MARRNEVEEKIAQRTAVLQELEVEVRKKETNYETYREELKDFVNEMQRTREQFLLEKESLKEEASREH